ncbi:MAG: glycosyltransferase family 39 protein [Phycisphaerae bacterium]
MSQFAGPVRYAPHGAELPPQKTPLAALILAMAVFILPTMVISQIAAHWRVDVVDDQMFGYFGWRIAHGARPYLDIWDNKPPGVYWMNALGMILGDDSYAGVVALCVVALLLTHVFYFCVCASVYHRDVAALATILAGFFLSNAYYQAGTNRTETFLVAFELAAALLYVRAFPRDRWWRWYLAGLCAGCAFLFKQVGLAAWGAMGLHTILLVLFRDIGILAGLRRCVLLLIGAATPVGLAALVLASRGALDAAIFAVFTFNRAYMATGDTNLTNTFANRWRLQYELWPVLKMPLLAALAAGIHSFLWWLRPQYRPPEIEGQLRALQPTCPRYMAFFGLWFGIALYGAFISPHAFRHYIIPSLPPLLLVAAYLINVLRGEFNLLRSMQRRGWITASLVLLGYLTWEAAYFHIGEVGRVWIDRVQPDAKKGFVAAEWEIVGDRVAALTTPSDTIQCWGFAPGVYLRSRRLNATRYTTMEKLGQVRGNADWMKREILETLIERRPTMLVMSATDWHWMGELAEVGRANPNSSEALDTRMRAWIDENYAFEEEVAAANTLLFRRKTPR